VTDGSGKHSLASVNLKVSGDSDGSPTEGLGKAIDEFFDAASMMSRSIPQPGGVTGKPTSNSAEPN
jgi:hypothetical protein